MQTQQPVKPPATLKEKYRELRSRVDEMLDDLELLEYELRDATREADAQTSSRYMRSLRNLASELGIKIALVADGKRRGRPKKE